MLIKALTKMVTQLVNLLHGEVTRTFKLSVDETEPKLLVSHLYGTW